VLALAACTDTAEPKDPETDPIPPFRSHLAVLDRDATEYLDRMEVATEDTCLPIRRMYDLEVRPVITYRMAELAPALDEIVGARGGAGFADLGCITDALHVELDAHLATECVIDDTASEARRHATAVGELLEAAHVRTDEMLAGEVFTAPPTPCP